MLWSVGFLCGLIFFSNSVFEWSIIKQLSDFLRNKFTSTDDEDWNFEMKHLSFLSGCLSMTIAADRNQRITLFSQHVFVFVQFLHISSLSFGTEERKLFY